MPRKNRGGRLAQAEECLAGGVMVRDWCAAKGVPVPTVLLRVRRLREEREYELVLTFVELVVTVVDRPSPAGASVIESLDVDPVGGTVEAAMRPIVGFSPHNAAPRGRSLMSLGARVASRCQNNQAKCHSTAAVHKDGN